MQTPMREEGDDVAFWYGEDRTRSPRSCFVLMLSRVHLFCNPMDCSVPGSSVHGIFQARVLEWIAFPFSRGSSQPRDRARVSRIAGGFFTS